jgi:lipopolysaccharide export LptBFGC system permease protein LptF
VLLAFGKMSAENELIALKSNGVSIARICAPVAFIAVVFVGICLWINIDVAPRAHERMTQMIFRVATSNPLSMFRSDKVIEEFPGRKIFVERHEGKELFNLLVYELGGTESKDDELKPMRIFFAKRGEVITDLANQQVLMRLYDARFSQRDDGEPDNFMKIREGIMKETTLPISLKELYEKKPEGQGNDQHDPRGAERSDEYFRDSHGTKQTLLLFPRISCFCAHRSTTRNHSPPQGDVCRVRSQRRHCVHLFLYHHHGRLGTG